MRCIWVRITICIQDFRQEIIKRNADDRTRLIPDEATAKIFSNIESIYQFHKEFLLPKLERFVHSSDGSVQQIRDNKL